MKQLLIAGLLSILSMQAFALTEEEKILKAFHFLKAGDNQSMFDYTMTERCVIQHTNEKYKLDYTVDINKFIWSSFQYGYLNGEYAVMINCNGACRVDNNGQVTALARGMFNDDRVLWYNDAQSSRISKARDMLQQLCPGETSLF